MKFTSKNFLALIRIIFGSVFILSSLTKLNDPASFTNALTKFHLLNNNLVPIFTYLIPAIELALGILLVLNIKTEIIAQLATFLVALFTAIVVSKITEGENISCGCFGTLTESNIDSTTIIRNIILLTLGITLAVYYKKEFNNKEDNNRTTIKKITKILESYWWKNLKITLLVTLFFFLGTQLLIFSFQNRELKNRLSLLTTDRDVLQPQDAAKPFAALDINGNKKEFDFNKDKNKKSLIYILSPHCEACKLNLQNWIYLTNTLPSKDLEIIGISLDSLKSTKDYVDKNNLNFPVYSTVDDKFKINYKAFITPQTLLIDEEGKVIKTWPGILNIFSIKELINKI
ncbi:MAG: MauE/DoxX family redox-associated membrane protein [Ignavibacteriaceae bacterium]